MLAVYAWYGIYPFGNRSILVADMNNQYISYFSYLKEALCGGHGFFYSFSKTLCGGMAGLTAYYLMDPWNLLMLFFPVFSLPTAVELITIWDSGNVLPCGIGNLHKFELKNEIWHSLSGGEVGDPLFVEEEMVKEKHKAKTLYLPGLGQMACVRWR